MAVVALAVVALVTVFAGVTLMAKTTGYGLSRASKAITPVAFALALAMSIHHLYLGAGGSLRNISLELGLGIPGHIPSSAPFTIDPVLKAIELTIIAAGLLLSLRVLGVQRPVWRARLARVAPAALPAVTGMVLYLQPMSAAC